MNHHLLRNGMSGGRITIEVYYAGELGIAVTDIAARWPGGPSR